MPGEYQFYIRTDVGQSETFLTYRREGPKVINSEQRGNQVVLQGQNLQNWDGSWGQLYINDEQYDYAINEDGSWSFDITGFQDGKYSYQISCRIFQMWKHSSFDENLVLHGSGKMKKKKMFSRFSTIFFGTIPRGKFPEI